MAHRTFRKLVFVGLTALMLVSTQGCRLKTPSATEQRYLIEKGAFPAGVPPWVSRVAISGGTVKRTSGLIPESFTVPPAAERSYIAAPEAIVEEPEPPIPPVTAEEKEKDLQALTPLDRVNNTCPGIESEATRAITAPEAAVRSQKLSALVNRCPRSSELWLWLGQSYAVQKKTAEAKQAFERARALDPQNAEARAELEKLRTAPVKK